jgi:CheY-like chemotaxis protein
MENKETTEQCELAKSITILLVEDNPGDIRLTREVFKEGKICNNLIIVEDGVEAIEYLKKTGKYKDALRPEIILLDLNLPKKDGRQVLAEIKADPDLMFIPVIVLTTSAAEQDILNMYAIHANAYITKPVDFDQFINVIRSIENFWLKIVKYTS